MLGRPNIRCQAMPHKGSINIRYHSKSALFTEVGRPNNMECRSSILARAPRLRLATVGPDRTLAISSELSCGTLRQVAGTSSIGCRWPSTQIRWPHAAGWSGSDSGSDEDSLARECTHADRAIADGHGQRAVGRRCHDSSLFARLDLRLLEEVE